MSGYFKNSDFSLVVSTVKYIRFLCAHFRSPMVPHKYHASPVEVLKRLTNLVLNVVRHTGHLVEKSQRLVHTLLNDT